MTKNSFGKEMAFLAVALSFNIGKLNIQYLVSRRLSRSADLIVFKNNLKFGFGIFHTYYIYSMKVINLKYLQQRLKLLVISPTSLRLGESR